MLIDAYSVSEHNSVLKMTDMERSIKQPPMILNIFNVMFFKEHTSIYNITFLYLNKSSDNVRE